MLNIISELNKLVKYNDKKMKRLFESYFCTFNSGNEIPSDVIFRKWPYSEINRFIELTSEIKSGIYSVNSLNKLIQNASLNQT